MATLVDKKPVRLNKVVQNTGKSIFTYYEEAPFGSIPGIKELYSDDSVIITAVLRFVEFDFEEKRLKCIVREMQYNPSLDSWGDITGQRGKYNNNSMTIDNDVLIRTEDETVNEVFYPAGTFDYLNHAMPGQVLPGRVGEFDYWLENLGVPFIFPPIHNVLMNK